MVHLAIRKHVSHGHYHVLHGHALGDFQDAKRRHVRKQTTGAYKTTRRRTSRGFLSDGGILARGGNDGGRWSRMAGRPPRLGSERSGREKAASESGSVANTKSSVITVKGQREPALSWHCAGGSSCRSDGAVRGGENRGCHPCT